MKKVISILLSLFILYSNTGWALAYHYCKEELASVSLAFSDVYAEEKVCQKEETCCAFEEDHHKKCCENKQVEPSDLDEKVISKSLEINPLYFPTAEINFQDFWSGFFLKPQKQISAFYTEINAPPLYKLYCQLIFYA